MSKKNPNLTAEQKLVMFEDGTEPPGTSELNKEKRKVTLSIKDLEEQEQKIAIKKFGSKDSGGTISDILGPLLKKKTKTEKK